MHADRVDLLLQYALLKAGEEDSFMDRDLGPIHLLKYVYLGDLAYARAHNGETYTGVPWRFYHFGPWSNEVFTRIEPAMVAVQARKFEGQSDFEDRSNWVRWSRTDRWLLSDLQSKVPSIITLDLDRLVHQFRKDTPSLLDYVYQTAPMLSAAPGESLDFSSEPQPTRSMPAPEAKQLSVRQTKKLRAAAEAIRAKYAKSTDRMERFIPKPPPLDEVHEQGMVWLDQLDGQPLSATQFTVEFSPEVWKSAARKTHGVP